MSVVGGENGSLPRGAVIDCSIVVPCYNEVERLPRTLQSICRYCDRRRETAEIICVDDGSSDGTAELVGELAGKDNRIRLIGYSPNRGKGYAVRRGMLAARGELVLFMDADGATPVHELEGFRSIIAGGEADIVIGSRRVAGARLEAGQRRLRRLASGIFAMFTRLLVLRGVKDSQCGFKLFTAAAARLVFSEAAIDSAAFDIEILVLAAKHNLKVREQPVSWKHDEDSRLSYNLARSMAIFRELWRIKLKHRLFMPARPA